MYYYNKIKMMVSQDAFWNITYNSLDDKNRAEKFAKSLGLLHYTLHSSIDNAISSFVKN